MKLVGLGIECLEILQNLKQNIPSCDVAIYNDEDVDDLEDVELIKIEANGEGAFKHEKFDSSTSHFPCQPSGSYVILFGGSDISGAILRILENIENSRVIYIKPDVSNLSKVERLQERVTYSVLQEFARSAKFEKIILFDEAYIGSMLGDIPISKYRETIQQHIIYNLYMYLFIESNKPIFGRVREDEELLRIFTLGTVQNGKEVMLFPLSNEKNNVIYPVGKHYYYLASETELNENSTLMKDIKTEITTINGVEEDEIGYAVHEANNVPNIYKLVVLSTSMVQE